MAAHLNLFQPQPKFLHSDKDVYRRAAILVFFQAIHIKINDTKQRLEGKSAWAPYLYLYLRLVLHTGYKTERLLSKPFILPNKSQWHQTEAGTAKAVWALFCICIYTC